MGRPKKDIDTEAIGVRITKTLLSKLDEYAKVHAITRSAAAAQGIKLIVNSKECINCGTLNPSVGVNCAKCGTPLYDDVEIIAAMTSILGIVSGGYIVDNKEKLKKYKKQLRSEKFDIENEIEYIVTCQSPDAEFKVDATGLPVEGIYAKSEFCYKCMTKDYFAVIKVTCKDDPHALLKVSLFVNGKYKGDYYGNQSAFVSERLKGTGPYLQ